MSNREDDSIQALILAAVVVFALIALWISRELGASFASVLNAAVATIIVGGITLLTIKFADAPICSTISGALAVIWWFWGPVLDSAARGGRDEQDAFVLFEPPWWTSGVFWWAIEILLLVALVLCLRSWLKDRY